MKYVFALFLALNALVSAMGFAKAYDLASLPQLQPISRPVGLLWLVTAVLYLTAAVLLTVSRRMWWVPAAAAIVVATIVIVLAWGDAKWGMLANLAVLVPVIIAALAVAPWNFQAQFKRDVANGLAITSAAETTIITESDVAYMPAPVQRYLRFAGVVGKPRVANYRVRFKGTLTQKAGARPMNVDVEQLSFADPSARLFLVHTSMFGVPAEAYHRYVGDAATFRVKAASLVNVVDNTGPALTRAETVTLFNDMCLIAPATLLDKRVTWDAVDDTTAVAHFANAGNSIAATLTFDPQTGALDNFVSYDRERPEDRDLLGLPPADSPTDRMWWETPISEWGVVDGITLPVRAVAIWHGRDKQLDYGHFEIVEAEYNVTRYDR